MKSVTIADYMTKHLVTFRPEDSVFYAMDVFLDRNISGAPVVNDRGELVGVLSEVDVMQVVIQGSYYDETEGIIADYMKSPVDTVAPDLDIYSLAERFVKEHRRRFPVVRDGKLVGQISRRDVLRAMREFVVRDT